MGRVDTYTGILHSLVSTATMSLSRSTTPDGESDVVLDVDDVLVDHDIDDEEIEDDENVREAISPQLAGAETPYQKAVSYLEKHGVVELFQTLTSHVVRERPDNPLEVMASKLEKIIQRRDETLADEFIDEISSSS